MGLDMPAHLQVVWDNLNIPVKQRTIHSQDSGKKRTGTAVELVILKAGNTKESEEKRVS
jgi:hypothetical protein